MSAARPLARREQLAYGLGDFASVLYWQTFMVYLTYFYTDVFGLTAAAVGAMLGISRSLDALLDPVVGMLADRTDTRWGKFRPYLLWLCVPFSLAGVLTFTVPALGPSGKLLWAWITYNLLMLLYTGINIPYTSMLGVLTPDAQARTKLTSIKFVFAFAAGTLLSATLLPATRALGQGDTAAGFSRSFMVIGAVAIACFLLTFAFTRERVRPPAEQQSSVLRDLRDLFGNRPWLVLLVATLASILFVAVRSSVTVHYFKYYVGAQNLSLPTFIPGATGPRSWSFEELVSAFTTEGQLASLLGVLLLPGVTARLGRKRAFVGLFLLAIIGTAAFFWLRADQLLWIFALNFVVSLCAGPLSALLWAMYADTADYGEWKNGRRSTGLVFSASAFSQKQGWALGAWLSLGLMQHVGFTANVAQSEASLRGLVWLMSLVPAALGLVAVLLMLAYPLDERTLTRVGAELEQRRRVEP